MSAMRFSQILNPIKKDLLRPRKLILKKDGIISRAKYPPLKKPTNTVALNLMRKYIPT